MDIRRMAWRNLWRNRRRTLVTVGAMTLALFVMILYQALMQGMLQDMERGVLEVEIGDLQIHAAGYLDSPSIYTVIEDQGSLLEALRSAGYRASPRLVGGSLVAAAESAAGALLRGLDLAHDPTVSEISTKVAKGEWLDESDPTGVVLGFRLARTLGVDVGAELVALSQATDGSIANELFFVRGILESVGEATDRAAVLLSESAFRTFYVLDEGAHQIIVRRPASVEIALAEIEVSELAPTLDVKSWRSLLPTLAAMLDTAKAAIQFVSVIVYIAIGILILNAMLMAVFERVREFGVLKALGVEPRQVWSLIIVESAFQTVLAVAVGLLLATPSLWYLVRFGVNTGPLAGTGVMGMTFMAIWRAVVTPATIGWPIVILLIIVFIAVLYPARKAARISPVEAMRYQ
jgi:ABC-type lipoprotein release transport system permease subunit